MRKIKTTKIGQKDYVDVSERVIAFWLLHPKWSLRSEIHSFNEETGTVLVHSWVEDDTGKIRADGHAFEFQADKKSRVNMTSFVENCETSALGRALGIKGLGTEYGIASANEVRNAKEKEAEMKALQLKNYQDKADEVDPPKGGEQKIVLDEGDQEPTSGLEIIKDMMEEVVKAGPTVEPDDLLTKDAPQEMIDNILGKKAPVLTLNDSKDKSEKEEEYLVEFNRRVSTLKNSTDAKALADEGREWSSNWTYKKDTYKTMYACISESFAAFKRAEDNAESANLKGGS